jgi:hypothetical protein
MKKVLAVVVAIVFVLPATAAAAKVDPYGTKPAGMRGHVDPYGTKPAGMRGHVDQYGTRPRVQPYGSRHRVVRRGR